MRFTYVVKLKQKVLFSEALFKYGESCLFAGTESYLQKRHRKKRHPRSLTMIYVVASKLTVFFLLVQQKKVSANFVSCNTNCSGFISKT